MNWADAEKKFLADGWEVGLTESGNLALRKDGSWRPPRNLELERWLRQYMDEEGVIHLWTPALAATFKTFLASGATELPRETVYK